MAKSEYLAGISMRLFGSPYQFTDRVDPRISDISKYIGSRFAKNIMAEAPVLTVLPGRAQYLPGKSKDQKYTATTAFLDASIAGNDSSLKQFLQDNGSKKNKSAWRLYDFELAYSEYMDYVNMLCRAGAAYLGLPADFKIDVGGYSATAQSFDWRKWHWSNAPGASEKPSSNSSYTSTALKFNAALKTDKELSAAEKKEQKKLQKQLEKKLNKAKTDEEKNKILESEQSSSAKKKKAKSNSAMKLLRNLTKNYNYVQFYIDPEISHADSFSNSTSESMLTGLINNGSSLSREYQAMANAATGIDVKSLGEDLAAHTKAISAGAAEFLDSGNSGVKATIKRIINLGGEVVKGNNVIMPEIYQSSSSPRSYDLTVHLKTPYGNKFSYFMDIYVPMMHLLALCIPRQATANSYSEPFLIKAYVDGLLSVSLGIVEDISITRATDTLNSDGLPTEVDVTISIKDLYSDLMMNSAKEPNLFINNTNLTQYLGTTCGMSLVNPNFATKYALMATSNVQQFKDIKTSFAGLLSDTTYNAVMQAEKWLSWLPATFKG